MGKTENSKEPEVESSKVKNLNKISLNSEININSYENLKFSNSAFLDLENESELFSDLNPNDHIKDAIDFDLYIENNRKKLYSFLKK